MEQLKNYIYMDMVGLDSLLSQITCEFVEESHIQTTKRKTGEAKGELGFSELVKKLFKAGVSVSGELESVQTINKKMTQPYETKIQQIAKYIQNNEVLLKDRKEIIEKYTENKQIFIYAKMLFDTDFNYEAWFDAVALAEKIGYLFFYKGGTNNNKDNYQYNDSYYKTMDLDKTKIVMNMSVQKMERFGGITSHLAVLFRETKGLNVPLGVFGHVYRVAPSVYQIKPYAIWRS